MVCVGVQVSGCENWAREESLENFLFEIILLMKYRIIIMKISKKEQNKGIERVI